MLVVFEALFPIFLIIALGNTLKRLAFIGNEIWLGIEKAVYFIFFPCLLFTNLATADLTGIEAAPMAMTLGFAQLLMAALAYGLRTGFGLNGPAFSSVFQGVVRWNSFVAIAAAQSLYGATGVTLAAISVGVLVPMANVMSVFVLTQYAGEQTKFSSKTVLTIIRNPLILACVLGMGLNATGWLLPRFLMETTSILGNATLSLGLLSVGAGLYWANMTANKLLISLTTVFKLLLMPTLTIAFGRLLGISGDMLTVAILCAGVPSATSSYILARQLGGDADLMASLITVGTLMSLITLPFVLSLA